MAGCRARGPSCRRCHCRHVAMGLPAGRQNAADYPHRIPRPYALTWNVAGGSEWRFTMHAYPLYLAASISGAVFCWQLALGLWRRPWREGIATRRSLLRWIAGAAVIAAVTAAYHRCPGLSCGRQLPREPTSASKPAFATRCFSAQGGRTLHRWTDLSCLPRRSRSRAYSLCPEQRPYQVVLRLDPVAPDRQHRAVVLLNRQLLATSCSHAIPNAWVLTRCCSRPTRFALGRTNSRSCLIRWCRRIGLVSHLSRAIRRELLGVRLWYLRVLASADSGDVLIRDRVARARPLRRIVRLSSRKLNFRSLTDFQAAGALGAVAVDPDRSAKNQSRRRRPLPH